MTVDKQEVELLDGFRQLDPADKNTVLTAVSMALTAENNIRRQFQNSPACGGACVQAPASERQVVNA